MRTSAKVKKLRLNSETLRQPPTCQARDAVLELTCGGHTGRFVDEGRGDVSGIYGTL